MADKGRRVFGFITGGVFLGIVLMVALIGMYERNRRAEKSKDAQAKIDAVAEALPDMSKVKRLQVIYKQRVQPLDTVARRRVREISGKRKLYGAEPALTLMSIAFDGPDFWDDIPCISVIHHRNKEFVGMSGDQSLATPRQVRESEKLAQQANKLMGESFGDLIAMDQEVLMMRNALRLIDTRCMDVFHIVPPTEEQTIVEEDAHRFDWYAPNDIDRAGYPTEVAKTVKSAWRDFEKAWTKRDQVGVNDAVTKLDEVCRGLRPDLVRSTDKIDAELGFNRLQPFSRASWLYFFAAAFALFSGVLASRWMRWTAVVLAAAGILLEIWGFYWRVNLGFGVAIQNLYESMVAVALAAMIIGLIVDLRRKGQWAIMACGLGAFIILQVVDHFSVKFDDAIGGTIAVLANNIWIHIHVPVVMTAYAGYFGAFLLSCIALPWVLFSDRRARTPELKSLLHTAELLVNVATPFMLAGLVLGGVWASKSWGRFWGWDPKETWALILFLYYIIVIHGRFTGWLNPFWHSLTLFFGGSVLLWTYYGTNEFLVGLHSYAGEGQAGGMAERLFHAKNLWFTASNAAIIAICLLSVVYYMATGKAGAASTKKAGAEPPALPKKHAAGHAKG